MWLSLKTSINKTRKITNISPSNFTFQHYWCKRLYIALMHVYKLYAIRKCTMINYGNKFIKLFENLLENDDWVFMHFVLCTIVPNKHISTCNQCRKAFKEFIKLLSVDGAHKETYKKEQLILYQLILYNLNNLLHCHL